MENDESEQAIHRRSSAPFSIRETQIKITVRHHSLPTSMYKYKSTKNDKYPGVTKIHKCVLFKLITPSGGEGVKQKEFSCREQGHNLVRPLQKTGWHCILQLKIAYPRIQQSYFQVAQNAYSQKHDSYSSKTKITQMFINSRMDKYDVVTSNNGQLYRKENVADCYCI